MKSDIFIASPYSFKFPPFIIGMIFLIIAIITYFNLVQDISSINTIFSSIFMVSGVLEILFSIRNKTIFTNWKWSFSFGLLTYIIGILLISEPSSSRDIISFYNGIYFIFRAIFSINFGIEMFKINNYSAYLIIGLGFVLILLGAGLVWLPGILNTITPILDGTAFLITGFLIFYIYNSIKNMRYMAKFNPQLD